MTSPPTDAAAGKEAATPTEILKWQVEALEGQADVQKVIGHADEAIKGYTQALELMATEAPVTRRADLYHKLATAYHDKGQFDAAQEALNKGLAVLDGQVCLEAGRLHVYTGLIHFRRGRFPAGLASCEQGISIISKTSNIGDLARAYNLQGLISRHMGESKKALKAYQRCLALYEQAEYLPGQERAFFNLGSMYKDLGQWNAALDCFEKSKALSERTGEMRRQAAARNGLGEIYRRQGLLERAIEVYTEALRIVEERNFQEFTGIALMNLGASYLKEGSLTLANAYLEKSLNLFQRLQAQVHLPEVLSYLAELKIYSKQATEARQLAEKAVALCAGGRMEEGPARRSLGQAYRALGKFQEATIQLEQSLELLERYDNPYEIGLTLVELALLCQAQALADQNQDNGARRQQAMAFLLRAIAIFEKVGAALELKRAQEIRRNLWLKNK